MCCSLARYFYLDHACLLPSFHTLFRKATDVVYSTHTRTFSYLHNIRVATYFSLFISPEAHNLFGFLAIFTHTLQYCLLAYSIMCKHIEIVHCIVYSMYVCAMPQGQHIYWYDWWFLYIIFILLNCMCIIVYLLLHHNKRIRATCFIAIYIYVYECVI